MKFVIYARKSSEDENRQVQSIDDQIELLQKIACDRGLEVVEVLKESASAKAPGRPLFNKMLGDFEKGKYQGVLVWKLDRLARNPVDGGAINWMLQQGVIQKIATSDRDYVQGDNVLMMSVEFGMANQFILDLSKNTKRGMQSKCRKGWRPGVAPPGYLNNKYCDKGEKYILKDPDRFDLVRKMWDLMLTGAYNPNEILRIANEEWGYITVRRKKSGGNALARSTIYTMFTNPFYYGEFEYGGERYQGSHDPMVTKDEYDRVQQLLGRDGRPRPKKHVFPFTGMIRCGECGCFVTAERKTKYIRSEEKIRAYTYYHCTKKKGPCAQRSIKQDQIESEVCEFLGKLEITEHLFEWAKKYLHEVHDGEVQSRQKIYKNQERTYQDCVKRLDNLIKLKIAPGNLLSDEEFSEHKGALLREKEQLKKSLDAVDSRQNNWVESVEKVFEFARYAPANFRAGTLEEKKTILNILGQNFVLKDQQLLIEAKTHFVVIKEGLERIDPNKERLEPSKMASNNAFKRLKESWLRGWDSNPRPID